MIMTKLSVTEKKREREKERKRKGENAYTVV